MQVAALSAQLRKFTSVGAILALAPFAAQAQVVGAYDGGNCYPFSCLASDSGGSTYQQVYLASAFSGTTTFNTIRFFQDSPGLMDSATYDISFSTTSASVGALDSTWANNIGGDSAFFGTFTLGGSMPSVLTLTGNAFNYDPTLGNLLMHVGISNLTEAHGYESYFQADYAGVEVSRMWAYGGSSTGSTGTGALRTEFTTVAAPVPEPETYAMMLAGLGLLGVMARRRKQKLNA